MGIAKKVMDAHSGRIEVQSKAATGTEFRISIPLADAVRAEVKPKPGRTQPAHPGRSDQSVVAIRERH